MPRPIITLPIGLASVVFALGCSSEDLPPAPVKSSGGVVFGSTGFASGGGDDEGADEDGEDDTGDDNCTPLECGADIGCGEVDNGCGEMIDCGSCTLDVPLGVSHLAGSPASPYFYATTTPESETHPSRLVSISPADRDVVGTLDVGERPAALTVTDDGRKIWVGVHGAIVEVSVNGEDMAVEATYPFAEIESAIAALVIMPGAEDELIFSFEDFRPDHGFGRLRGGTVSLHPTTQNVQSLVVAGNADIWGYENDSTGHRLCHFSEVAGRMECEWFHDLVHGFGAEIFGAGERIYGTDGSVVDISDVGDPVRIGHGGRGLGATAGFIEPEIGRAILLSGSEQGTGSQLSRVDLDSFAELETVGLPTISASRGHDVVVGNGAYLGFLDSFTMYVLANPFNDSGCRRVDCDERARCGTVSDGCGGTVECGVCSSSIDGLEVEEVAVSADGQNLFATVGQGDPRFPNSLVLIDVASEQIVGSTPVGSRPGALAVSPAGDRVWVGLKGRYGFREVIVDGDDLQAGEFTRLPMSETLRNRRFGGDLEAVSDREVAVLGYHMYSTPASNRFWFYRDGQRSSLEIGRGQNLPAKLWPGPDGWLLGTNNTSEESVFAVEPTVEGPVSTQIEVDADSSQATYADGYLYGWNGEVIDVSDPLAASWTATGDWEGPVAVGDSIYVLRGYGQIDAYHSTSLEHLGDWTEDGHGAASMMVYVSGKLAAVTRQDGRGALHLFTPEL